jgi:hypothetical protein
MKGLFLYVIGTITIVYPICGGGVDEGREN